MKLDQRGMAHVWLIALAVLIIGVVGFAAYRVGSNKKADTNQTVPAASTPAKEEKTTGAKNKTHAFKNTFLTMDIPESWQVDIDHEENGAYKGTIKASNGWGINFTASHGGFGGGPGCNFENMDPDLPPCPTYTVLVKEKLQTGDYLMSYSSSGAGKYDGMGNCAIVTAADKIDKAAEKTGSSYISSPWNCFGTITANDLSGGNNPNNLPEVMLFSVVYPYFLNTKPASDYINDPSYKEVIEALKTLRKG